MKTNLIQEINDLDKLVRVKKYNKFIDKSYIFLEKKPKNKFLFFSWGKEYEEGFWYLDFPFEKEYMGNSDKELQEYFDKNNRKRFIDWETKKIYYPYYLVLTFVDGSSKEIQFIDKSKWEKEYKRISENIKIPYTI